jgi:hypothetical protein
LVASIAGTFHVLTRLSDRMVVVAEKTVTPSARLPVAQHEREPVGLPGGGEGQRPTADFATVQGFSHCSM